MERLKKWLAKKPISDRLKSAMEDEDIIQVARMYGFLKIRHPMNIAEWVLPRQKMTLEQIYRELWTTTKEKKKEEVELFSNHELWELNEYKKELKKKLKDELRDNAETYLNDVFKNKHEVKAEAKSRLALDVLKATDKDYNQTTNSQVTVNLADLPLWDWLIEAQKRVIVELWITEDIFSQIDNE